MDASSTTVAMNMQSTIVMVMVLTIYNVSTIKLLSVALEKIDVGRAVEEKGQTQEPVPNGAVVATDTSYSRVSGMIGAIILATFFWSLGNVVLYLAFANPDKIAGLTQSLGTFFLGGASLFLPYSFNQLREAFAPTKK